MVFSTQHPPHLSVGRVGISDFVSHRGKNGDEPGLAVELVTETSTGAAEQSGEEVLIASAELTVLQVVLQQPERRTQSIQPLITVGGRETIDHCGRES